MKKSVCLIVALVLCFSGCVKEDKAELEPSGIVVGVEGLDVYEKEANEDLPSEEVAKETLIQYEAVLTEEPVNSASGNITSENTSASDSSGNTSHGNETSHGFDIEGDDEVYDYGVVCGRCGGPWDVEGNYCPHCFPR